MILNHLTQEVVRGFKLSAILIRYVLAWSGLLPTMLQLESIGYDSSWTWILHVHATIILSNREDIYYTSVKDLMGIGTLEETRWSISQCFWLLIWMLLHSLTIKSMLVVIFFSLLLISSFIFSLSFSSSLLLHVSVRLLYIVTKVATTVCPHVPCNKLLI